MRKLASIKVLLQAVTGLMALVLVAVFASSAQEAYLRRASAEHVHTVVGVSRDLFMAMQNIRVERGTGNTGLETATPIDAETQREIEALRAGSNTALNSALAKVKDMGIPASNPGVAQILSARDTFDHIRIAVDAAMQQPKSERLPGLSGLWVAGGARLVNSSTLSPNVSRARSTSPIR